MQYIAYEGGTRKIKTALYSNICTQRGLSDKASMPYNKSSKQLPWIIISFTCLDTVLHSCKIPNIVLKNLVVFYYKKSLQKEYNIYKK